MAKKESKKDDRIETIAIPVQISESDKADLLDRIVENQRIVDTKRQEITDFKAKQKEDLNVLQDDLDGILTKTEGMIKTAMDNKIVKEMECIPTKNFEYIPAMLEYRSPKNIEEVFYSRPLQEIEMQVEIGEKVIGVPPKKYGKMDDDGLED